MADRNVLDGLRDRIRATALADEAALVHELTEMTHLSAEERCRICAEASQLVRHVRARGRPGIIEQFLNEYGLSTREGIALMCLAEAVLRVPDAPTLDALIRDKVAAGEWGHHLSRSSSMLVNASTWALLITGRVIAEDEEEGLPGALHSLVRRLGEPVVRLAVEQAMRELGQHFVLGTDMGHAMARASKYEARGYTYSYDMLGEAARTAADAQRYFRAYAGAIEALAPKCARGVAANPGISVKLSALHPRYEFAQRERVLNELVPRLLRLARMAKDANMGLNIDAEEAERLDLSLDVFEAVLSEPSLSGWEGLGAVVQAYSRRAPLVLDWLYALAKKLERRIMVRLVKGAYWDTEIKRAQLLGLSSFPVFTRKASTDVSYIACARKLLAMHERIYAQFATHNAHTMTTVLHMAGPCRDFEFQRLHGMGEVLHEAVKEKHGIRCRIYAPVGEHRDLLAYLVRRLLENGANSSFVHQIVDETIPPGEVARDPFAVIAGFGPQIANSAVTPPAKIYCPVRTNSKGWDLADPLSVARLDRERDGFAKVRWCAAPIVAGNKSPPGTPREVRNPARPEEITGIVEEASASHAKAAIEAAAQGFVDWSARTAGERAACLKAAARAFENHAGEFFALACREAGKTLPDCVAEVREAVDFLHYYASEVTRLEQAEPGEARGIFVCISPWNFPLAIFTGQIAAALATGNAVIAKPAEQTPLIAMRAVELLHEAGVPRAALQLLPGEGAVVGGALTGDQRIAGVCFTGSTETAQIIHRNMAEHGAPDAVLIAETGGLNAMILDSTALPEQAVRDILTSAFQSAGQRCSSLRILYVQSDVAVRTLEMLFGAMDELSLGDPWALASDIGPVIDEEARGNILSYIDAKEREGRVVKKLAVPETGRFVPPTVLRVSGIEELEREIFGPVLHVATYEAGAVAEVVDAINARGYGLTFGLHTRIDRRVQEIVDRLRVGNIYVNRNQIGSIVGSQPFGGEGMSGTGPKAGGPLYLRRFRRRSGGSVPLGARLPETRVLSASYIQQQIDALSAASWRSREDRLAVLRRVMEAKSALVRDALNAAGVLSPGVWEMPGPTGESNRLTLHPRGVMLCLGPGVELAAVQVVQALAFGNPAIVIGCGEPEWAQDLADAEAPLRVLPESFEPRVLRELRDIAAVCCAADKAGLRALRIALAERPGPIVPLICEAIAPECCVIERHLCIDTTAAGGNAALLAESA